MGSLSVSDGEQSYLLDSELAAASDARPHLTSPAIEVFYEMLSGMGEAALKGSTILPLDDPASFCVAHQLVCTTIDLEDPKLQEKLASAKEQGIAACIGVMGPFERAAYLLGWEEAICAAATNDTEYFDSAVANSLQASIKAGKMGADCIVISDDISSPSGHLVPASFVSEYALTWWRQMAENANALGIPTILHSDGDIREHYQALADCEISGVHIATGNDLDLIKECFSEATSFELVPIGGIPAGVLSSGDDTALERLRSFVIDLARQYPKSIIADDGGMTTALELDMLAHVY